MAQDALNVHVFIVSVPIVQTIQTAAKMKAVSVLKALEVA
ncbi:hypothetical protein HMPREF0971_02312 [Segatella oris F0302]|uniref:Uncharacterized protein n=1 Tax=Segatella oris F0302 TaxID=649760 RepID=D1QTI3_9BACT|nr:hypothetical protein HMPREF0971_02312 [Segatella oris F0302]